ncbi:LysR family transcriptional regulator [Paenibacillus pasadenensis]|uniref:LysR family transcriptional regulator n=1 Tax=Paenibacillus pasadenensis TaxID=217090 RepID=UPI00203DD351|nr:LysR family transcriptional regulator [Paenibacillus pasadenensis]MCM3747542.1 LysR family transcriptional regulator [Paenibacillus pasadenensis]
MELRQLQYVIHIAKELNFSRAAEKLHIAQPSLSQQLSKLEKEIGVLLVRRTTNSVELTHAGEVFVDKAQAILDSVEQLKTEMEDMAHMRRGRLVIGSLPITGSHILPIVLPEFGKQYPDIDLVLIEDTTAKLEQLAGSGQTDISLLSLPLIDSTLVYEPLIREEITLAVPPNHWLAGRTEPVDLETLQDEPFIVLKKGQGFRQIAIDLCAGAGFQPRIVFESSNIETVQSLVAAGMGVAFIPHMIARGSRSEFTPHFCPIAGKPSRSLVIASRKGRYLSKAAEAFIDTMKAAVIKHYGQ